MVIRLALDRALLSDTLDLAPDDVRVSYPSARQQQKRAQLINHEAPE